jgi:hypothetical protein
VMYFGNTKHRVVLLLERRGVAGVDKRLIQEEMRVADEEMFYPCSCRN